MHFYGPLRADLSRFRKRSKLALDGGVPGVEHGRRIPRLNKPPGSIAAPRRYASFHADAYNPPPGEMAFLDSSYSPYRANVAHHAPDELHSPPPGFHPGLDWGEHDGPPIDDDFADGTLQHAVPEIIPFDNDVWFEGSIGPTIGDSDDDRIPINELWDRVLSRPTYGSLLMTDELFDQAMQEALAPFDVSESVAMDDAELGEGLPFDEPTLLEPLADQFAGDGFGLPDDGLLDGAHDWASPAAEQLGYDADPGGLGSLEQIVDEFTPSIPDPMVEEEMLMDPYGMMPPGMGPAGPYGPMAPGPMPPGFGPMGPGM